MFFAVSFNPEKNLTVAHNFYKRHHRLQWRLWVEVANDSFQWQQASFKHSTAGWKKKKHTDDSQPFIILSCWDMC